MWIDPENRETRPLTKFVVKSTTQVMDREQVTGRQIRYGRGETVTLQVRGGEGGHGKRWGGIRKQLKRLDCQ